MANDLDIQLGEVEEAEPEVRLRPDDNKHFGVAPVFSPSKSELPIFVDLDAMIDMEDHALDDTSVELGGVMLGGQHLDEDGNPFVLITDSLRAKHYESTKGSFKFTHDTWTQITRERDEFPDELQMVGWYHTHPDWGVFLSGMDMFICDNFFNKTLDVALVIDPCRQDRGFFQWARNAGQRVRRTDGFYLVASRFRQDELDAYATYLEGNSVMAGNPRMTGAASGGSIVNVSPQPAWQTVAVFSMLTMQFCLLMLIAWKMLEPAKHQVETNNSADIAALQSSIERLGEVNRREAEVDAKLQVLDNVVSQWDGTPDRLLRSLAVRTSETGELRESVRAHEALERELDAKLADAKSQLQDAAGREGVLQKEIAIYEAKSREDNEELAELKKQLAALQPSLESGDARADGAIETSWDKRLIFGVVGLVVVAFGIAAFAFPKRDVREDELETEESAD